MHSGLQAGEMDLRARSVLHVAQIVPPMRMIQTSTTDPLRLKVKAAEARYLVPITAWLLVKFFVPNQNGHTQLRAQCFSALGRASSIIESDWGAFGYGSRSC